MGILESVLTLIAVVIAIVLALIPFEIIAKFFEKPKRPKPK